MPFLIKRSYQLFTDAVVDCLLPRYWEIDGQTSAGGQKTAGFFYKTSFSNGNVLLKNRWVMCEKLAVKGMGGGIINWKSKDLCLFIPWNSLMSCSAFLVHGFQKKKMWWTGFTQLALRIKMKCYQVFKNWPYVISSFQ